MKFSNVRILALLGVFAVSACSDDATGLVGDLSQAEAEDLAGFLFSQGFVNALTIQLAPEAQQNMARVIETYTETAESTAQCPLGGTIGLAASITYTNDTETGDASTEWSMTSTHNGCVGQGALGNQFTVDGNPSVAFTFAAERDGQSEDVSWSGGMTGGITFEAGDKTGGCNVNLEYSGSETETSTTFSLAGSICGTSISRSFTVSDS